MKKTNFLSGLIAIVALIALAMLFAVPAKAQLSAPQTAFSVSTTNPATTLSYLVVSERSANGGTPAVTYLTAGSDLASSQVTTYKVTHVVGAQYATNATTTLSVNNTNGFSSGDVIIIRHYLNDTYEKRILTTMTGSTNLVLTAAPVAAVIPGDTIYRVVTSGAQNIPWGATTNSVGGGAGGPIIVGQRGLPLLMEINATSTAGRLSCAGVYLP